jgi:hypothetical protein
MSVEASWRIEIMEKEIAKVGEAGPGSKQFLFITKIG